MLSCSFLINARLRRPQDDLDVVELLAADQDEKDAAMSLCKSHRLGSCLAKVLGGK